MEAPRSEEEDSITLLNGSPSIGKKKGTSRIKDMHSGRRRTLRMQPMRKEKGGLKREGTPDLGIEGVHENVGNGFLSFE